MQLEDTLPAEILLHYKSGQRHSFNENVKAARKRSETAIKRKSVHWVKVIIPSPDNTKLRISVWEPRHGWTTKIVAAPKTKD